ncbi:MAG: hypothetical protein ABSB32_08950 [Thermodesulfobacteriota bacterium]
MLSKMELLMLFEQRGEKSIDYKTLAEELNISNSSASMWLKRLHRQGLLTLTRKIEKKYFVLSEGGRRRLNWYRENRTNEKAPFDISAQKGKPNKLDLDW